MLLIVTSCKTTKFNDNKPEKFFCIVVQNGAGMVNKVREKCRGLDVVNLEILSKESSEAQKIWDIKMGSSVLVIKLNFIVNEEGIIEETRKTLSAIKEVLFISKVQD